MTDVDDHAEDLAEELRHLLHSLGAEPRPFEFTDIDRQRGEHDLSRVIGASPSDRRRRRARITRWPARVAMGTAAAAVLALVLIVIAPGTGTDVASARTPALLAFQYEPSDSGLSSDKSPRVALAALAEAAGAQNDVPVAAVQYIGKEGWFLSTDDSDSKAGGTSVLSAVSVRQYFLPDGMMRVVERRGGPLDAEGRVKAVADDGARTTSDETFDGPEEGPGYPLKLSTDPARLAQELVPAGACDGQQAFCLAERLTSLSYTYVLPSELRAALWRVLGDAPEISYLGKTHDRLDRAAVAFSLPGADPEYRLLLFADAKTGALLGSESVLVRDSKELGLHAPAVTEFTAIVDSRDVAVSDVPPAATSK